MPRQISQKAREREALIAEAVLGVQLGTYKSCYEAAKALGLSRNTVTQRVNGGLSRVDARQQQQLLSKSQEETLLKWIKVLTISGYAPSH